MMIKLSYHESLQIEDYSVDEIEFGSNNGNDTDKLYIVEPNIHMDMNLVANNHFFFYKDEEANVDKLFATPRMIVNSLISGTHDLPYHLLMTDKFKHTSLRKLHTIFPSAFAHTKNARCLLGVAKRDLKQASKEKYEKKHRFASLYLDYVKEMLAKNNFSPLTLTDSSLEDSIEHYRKFEISKLPNTVPDYVFDILMEEYVNNVVYKKFRLDFTTRAYFDNWKNS